MSSVFLYQMIHVAGRTVRQLEPHLEELKRDFKHLFGRRVVLDARRVEEEILEQLAVGRYPQDRSTILRLELSPQGEFSYRLGESSLYQGYVLRALRPEGHVASFQIPWEGLRSSAELAAWELAMHRIDHGVVLRADSQGVLLEADCAPLFALYGRRIYTSRAPQGVEGRLAEEAIRRAGYSLLVEPVYVEHLPLLDEIFYVDHRGVTALERCDGGKLLMTAFSKRIAEAMEQMAY